MPDSVTLHPGDCLDPRPSAVGGRDPRHAAVHLPLDELPQRTQELPPDSEPLAVAAEGALLAATLEVLRQLGRRGYGVPLPTTPANGQRFRLWRPTQVLEDWLALPPGRSLDLGCGSGRDVVYLGSLGWEALGVDHLPEVVTRGGNLARRYLADPTRTAFAVHDLEGDMPPKLPRVDLITGFRYLHRPLFPILTNWLNPGGHVLWETFTETHRARHGKPRRDAFVLREGELPTLLPGFEVLRHDEGWRGDVHTARVLARKVQ